MPTIIPAPVIVPTDSDGSDIVPFSIALPAGIVMFIVFAGVMWVMAYALWDAMDVKGWVAFGGASIMTALLGWLFAAMVIGSWGY